jgi:hypothetical protein
MGPGSGTGTGVWTEFCLGLRRRRLSAGSLACGQNLWGACAVPADVSNKVRRIFALDVWEPRTADSVLEVPRAGDSQNQILVGKDLRQSVQVDLAYLSLLDPVWMIFYLEYNRVFALSFGLVGGGGSVCCWLSWACSLMADSSKRGFRVKYG